MNIKKTVAATVAAATLGAGTFVLAGAASASPTAAVAAQNSASAGASPVKVHRPLRQRLRRAVIVVSAKTIGISPQELITQLKSGSSIAEVATAHHVDPSTVAFALVTAGNQRIDRAVANGKLTAARAALLKARLTKMAQQAVNFHRAPKPDVSKAK